MGRKRGVQKGAQRHAEGQHGPKTRAAFIEQLQSGPSGSEDAAESAGHDTAGENRLFERREQHDEAELNSEKMRLDRDIQDHGHVRENFQVRGGAESHPAMPRSHINPERPDAPNPSSELGPDETPTRVPGVGGS